MPIASGNLTVTFGFSSTISKTNTGRNDTTSDQARTTTIQFASIGAGANQFSELYDAVRTLAGGASETLDLFGSLVNDIGDTINFARVKFLRVELLNTTTSSSITVGNAASNPFLGPFGGTAPTFTILNGNGLQVTRNDATGWAVTNASNDNLRIVNNDGANTATYRITIGGSIT